MHLWVDGLEPESDFATAWQQGRNDAGWAPFWHYRRMGRYGEQLADLFSRVDRDRVLVMRYRQLVSEPVQTLNRVAAFLGIADDQLQLIPADNSRPFVEPGLRAEVLGRCSGRAPGRQLRPTPAVAPASRPLLTALQHGGPDERPKLAPEQRTMLLNDYHDDISTLEEVLGESFQDWREAAGRGSFEERAAPAPQGQPTQSSTNAASSAGRSSGTQ